jgi:hypothetical protein
VKHTYLLINDKAVIRQKQAEIRNETVHYTYCLRFAGSLFEMSIKKAHLHAMNAPQKFEINWNRIDFGPSLSRAPDPTVAIYFISLNVPSFCAASFLWLFSICVELFPFSQLISIAPQQWEIKQLLASFLTSHPRQWTFKFMEIIGLKCRVQGETLNASTYEEGEAFCKNLLN